MNEVKKHHIFYDDNRNLIRLKNKFHNTVMRLAMMYRSKCWAVDKKIKQRMSAVKMRMLK